MICIFFSDSYSSSVALPVAADAETNVAGFVCRQSMRVPGKKTSKQCSTKNELASVHIIRNTEVAPGGSFAAPLCHAAICAMSCFMPSCTTNVFSMASEICARVKGEKTSCMMRVHCSPVW